MFLQAWDYAGPYLAGFAVTLLWGQLVIARTAERLWTGLNNPKHKHHGASHSMILGLIEGALYVGALQLEHGEFIAVWLGLKTVIRWRHWDGDIYIAPQPPDTKPGFIYGRNAYNLFLLGNGLVILFAAVGSRVIDALRANALAEFVAIVGGLLVASIALMIVVYRSAKYRLLRESDLKPQWRLLQKQRGE